MADMVIETGVFLQHFRDAVTLLNGLRLAWLGGSRIFRPGQRTIPKFPTPKALRNAILRGDIAAGDKVAVKGYLSRYAHLVKPVSYLNSTTDIVRTVKLRQRIPNAIVSASWQASQLPVSCLPVTQTEEEKLNTLFLYPTSFTGFLYKQALDPKDELIGFTMGGDRGDAILRPRIAIPEQAWPIPVLVRAGKPGVPTEVKVELTVTAEELPSEILSKLEPIYKSHFQVDLLSNFLLLGRERVLSHCLYLDPSESEVRITKKADLTHRMVLYVEGHFENMADDLAVSDAIASIIPVHPALGGGSLTFHGGPQVQGRRMSATPEGLHIFIKPPAVVGLYGETSPSHGLGNVHKMLVSQYQALAREGPARLAQWSTGRQPRLQLDFTYDYARQWDFDTDGIWESTRAAQIITEDAGFEDTKRWLKRA
jgi:hypothetical protein